MTWISPRWVWVISSDRYQVQLSLRQKYQQQLEQLRRDSEQKGTYNTDDYRKAEQALTESLNRQLNENRRYWQQLEVVQGNWKNGVLRAFQDFTVTMSDNTAETSRTGVLVEPSATWEMAWQPLSLPANSISNPSPLLCCQIWRKCWRRRNHDEIDKRDWQCTGI